MSQSHTYTEIAGIIGGIGPEATNYFTSLLVQLRLQYAAKDQDHIPFLLFNNPQIPDRTEYLLKKSDVNPISEIIKTGIALKNAGATFLVMPCNTAHAFAEMVEEEVGLPLINMLDETAAYVQRVHGDKATVGVLATTGTMETKLFQKSFSKVSKNITVLTPDASEQEEVMKAIYDIKSNSVNDGNVQILYAAANKLLRRGASIIILGCTEIPLALKADKCKFFRIDTMEVLAKKVLEKTLLSKASTEKITRSKKETSYRVAH
jgi:aspartate racemase